MMPLSYYPISPDKVVLMSPCKLLKSFVWLQSWRKWPMWSKRRRIWMPSCARSTRVLSLRFSRILFSTSWITIINGSTGWEMNTPSLVDFHDLLLRRLHVFLRGSKIINWNLFVWFTPLNLDRIDFMAYTVDSVNQLRSDISLISSILYIACN